MAYSRASDLLIGDIRVDGVIDPEAVVQDAADEIDAAIGNIYVTPIALPDTAVNRPTILLLKRINNYIATGRLLLALAQGSGDAQNFAQAQYYLKLGLTPLNEISKGNITLAGAEKHTQEGQPANPGPTAVNAEPVSYVEAFYKRNTNPAWGLPGHEVYLNPIRLQ